LDEYATHVPVLARAIKLYAGSVLEMGTGRYSHPLIRALVPNTGNILVIEDDLMWRKAVRPMGRLFTFREFMGDAEANAHVDVVFVDGAAAQRAPLIEKMLPRCRALVLHDSNPSLDSLYGHLAPLKKASYLWSYNREYPSTTVASMSEDVAKAFADLED